MLVSNLSRGRAGTGGITKLNWPICFPGELKVWIGKWISGWNTRGKREEQIAGVNSDMRWETGSCWRKGPGQKKKKVQKLMAEYKSNVSCVSGRGLWGPRGTLQGWPSIAGNCSHLCFVETYRCTRLCTSHHCSTTCTIQATLGYLPLDASLKMGFHCIRILASATKNIQQWLK